MIIVIAGIKRSGSTWMYNAVRLLCYGDDRGVSLQHENFDIKSYSDAINIIKVHPFKRALYEHADMIFTSFRDIQAIKKSRKRCFGRKLPSKDVNNMVHNLLLWQRKSCFYMHYSDFMNDKGLEFEKIKGVLIDNGIDVNQNAWDELQQVKPENEYNPTTLLFPNHIS